MIKINFGTSDYKRYAPGVKPEEEIIEVSKSGNLPPVPYYGYIEGKKTDGIGEKGEKANHPCVTIPLKTTGESSENLLMLWVKERQEWIAIYHTRWNETNFYYDDHYEGPFTLDGFCKRNILWAYGIPFLEMEVDKVSRTSPSELERIAKNREDKK